MTADVVWAWKRRLACGKLEVREYGAVSACPCCRPGSGGAAWRQGEPDMMSVWPAEARGGRGTGSPFRPGSGEGRWRKVAESGEEGRGGLASRSGIEEAFLINGRPFSRVYVRWPAI